MEMKRLSYRYTKDNDEELNKIAKYLADSKPLQAAAEIYSDIEEMKNIMIDGMCHFVFTKVNGEHRDAYGTRASDIIERHENKEKAPSKRKPAFNGTFSYSTLSAVTGAASGLIPLWNWTGTMWCKLKNILLDFFQ